MRDRNSLGHLGRRRNDGFALVIALSLMAFVVLLIVSMGTLGRIETSRAYTHRQTALARQQALYALGLAIGQLQDAAGPDRRVTATAEILNASTTNPGSEHWTGVWDFTAGSPRVTWLVTADPASATGADPARNVADSAVMVSLDTVPEQSDVRDGTANWVRVPVLELRDEDAAGDEVPTGRVAWWTADEGVKASIHGLDTVGTLGLDPLAAQLLRQAANPGQAWPVWFGPGSELGRETQPDWTEGWLVDWLETLDPAQALTTADVSAATREVFHNRFHDLTSASWGLLTNPLEGGLKINLGTPAAPVTSSRFTDVFADGRVLRTWNDTPRPNEEGEVVMRTLDAATYAALDPGEPYVHVAPVLAECALFLSVFQYNYQGRVEPAVRYTIQSEFWNPFAFDLVLVESGDRRALTVEVSGLPELNVEDDTKGTESGPFRLDEITGPTGTGIRSWMQFGEASNSHRGGEKVVLSAGENYQLMDPDPFLKPSGLIRYSDQPHTVENNDSVILYGSRTGRGETDFFVTAGEDGSGPEFFRVSGVPYDEFRFGFAPPLDSSFPPYVTPSSAVDVADMYVMAFHYALGGTKRWEDPVDWVQAFDFRRPRIDFGGSWTDATGASREVSELIRVGNANPVLVKDSISELFPGTEVLFDRLPRESAWGAHGDVRLYDLPMGDPVTLADLRILPFKGLPPRALGSANPAAAELNVAFDRYFLSTAAPGWTPVGSGRIGDDVLPNTRLQVLPGEAANPIDFASETAAVGLWVRGAFNWNSTRVAAWYAALVRAFPDHSPWLYTDEAGEPNALAAEAALFRHGRAAFHRQDPLADAVIEGLPETGEAVRFASFRQGARFLARPDLAWDEIDGEADPLFRLATAIVDELKARGRPFPALSAFLADGVFDRAIEASGINEHFPPQSNGHFTQSDLVALLSAAPAVRSDTFVIRAMGEVLNPATGEREGEAWLEARVQRTIDFVDPNRRPDALPAPTDEGPAEARRFQIISFRWLDPALDI